MIPHTLDEIVTWYCEDCQEDITPSTEEARGSGFMNIKDTNSIDTEEQIFEDGPSHGVHSGQKHNNSSNSMENKHESRLVHYGHDSVQGHLIHSPSSNEAIERLQTSSDNEENSRLICNTAYDSDVSEISYLGNPTPIQQDHHVPAQPVEDPIWR